MARKQRTKTKPKERPTSAAEPPEPEIIVILEPVEDDQRELEFLRWWIEQARARAAERE